MDDATLPIRPMAAGLRRADPYPIFAEKERTWLPKRKTP
jgi:hypothetical protein